MVVVIILSDSVKLWDRNSGSFPHVKKLRLKQSLKHNLGRPGHDRNKELMGRQLSRKGGLWRGTGPGEGEVRLSLGGVAG